MIGGPRLQASSNQNPSGQLLRSITLAGDRSSAITDRTFQYYSPIEEVDVNQSTTDKESAPKLRTFRGWKRDTTHLDKSRLTKGLMRSQVSFLSFFLIDGCFVFNRCQVNQL